MVVVLPCRSARQQRNGVDLLVVFYEYCYTLYSRFFHQVWMRPEEGRTASKTSCLK